MALVIPPPIDIVPAPQVCQSTVAPVTSYVRQNSSVCPVDFKLLGLMLLLDVTTPDELTVKRSPEPTVKSEVGVLSPMPTKPLPLIVSLSSVPSAEDEEILNFPASE